MISASDAKGLSIQISCYQCLRMKQHWIKITLIIVTLIVENACSQESSKVYDGPQTLIGLKNH